MQQPSGSSTRKQVMQLLKTNGELSAKDLTAKLGITGMAVRRHLDALERDGLIEFRTIRQPMGRPTALYRLTELAESHFPKNYHTVALDLLGELEGEAGEGMVNRLFDLRKETLQHKYAEALENKGLHEKVQTLAEIQNENGYMVELQQESDDTFLLKEHNCPIAQIANHYNHACQCELNLFESLLNANVHRTECLAKGDNKCVYVIKKKDDLNS
ncbi:helix-turn-helix transcriptional regulator [Paenibacillus marinisediminis]